MSHISAMSIPAPTATPFTAAITGLSSSSIAYATRWMRSVRLRLTSSGSDPRALNAPRSTPEQKPSPAPVRISARTSGSVRASRTTSAQVSIISSVNAFLRSGRLSRMVPTPSATSYSRSATCASPSPVGAGDYPTAARATRYRPPSGRDPACGEPNSIGEPMGVPDEPTQDAGGERAPWRRAVRPYTEPTPWRTWRDLATSVLPYLGLLAASYLAIAVSPWLALALAPLTAAFLLRTFVVFHDCTHGSLFRSRQANRRVGTVLGLLLYTPYESFAHTHAVHHATA